MNRTENIWFQLAILHILFGCFCRGQVSLAPADVPWKNEPWTLVCSVDSIVATVSIVNPSGTTVGYCDPSDEFSPAICSPSVGFVINETADTVSMTRTIASSETGSWACQHSSKSGTYILSSPLPNRTLPDSSASYGMHSMSPVAGSEITTDTVHNFTYHYGCVSSGLKFVWTIMPDSSLEDTSSTMSNGFACTTNSAYMSTIDESATILQAITSTGKKLKVSVYVDGYSNLPIVEYTYDVTFAPGLHTSTPTTITTTMTPRDQTCFFNFINESDVVCVIIVVAVCLVIILLAVLICCKCCPKKTKRSDKEENVKSQQLIDSNESGTSDKYLVQKETNIDESSEEITRESDEKEKRSTPDHRKSSSESNDTIVNQHRVTTKSLQQVQKSIGNTNRISEDENLSTNCENTKLNNTKELVHM